MKLNAAKDSYLARRKPVLAQNSYRSEKTALTLFAEEMGGELSTRSLTAPALEDYFRLNERMAGYKPSSFNIHRSAIRGLVQWLTSRGLVEPQVGTVFEVVRSQRRGEDEKLRLSPRQVLQLIESQEDPLHRFVIALLANTACRQAELLDLRVGDVDLQRGVIHVRVTKTRQVDEIPITSDLDAEIRRWLLHYQEKAPGLHKGHYLIPSTPVRLIGPSVYVARYLPGSKHYRLDSIVNRALDTQGWRRKGTGCHTIRRSMARAYYESLAGKGHSHALTEVAALLHHKNTAMTEYYIGASLGREKRDETMRGKPFLSSMVDNGNVVDMGVKRGNNTGTGL